MFKSQNKYLLLLFLIIASIRGFSFEKINIWDDVPSMKQQKTKMLIYPAAEDNNTGAAVIICPGGSYHHLGIPHEGKRVAEWFNSQGISAFVLCYRVSGRGYHHPAMIEDFQRAIQIVRDNAEQYGIDTNKIGAIGFSAGGHLVLTAGAYGTTNYLNNLAIKTETNLRPNWVAAIYPVVSMQDELAHQRSRRSLLGKTPSQELKDMFSMEKAIPDDMPPVFLLASIDDDVVDYRNSEALSVTLNVKNIPHKYLLFETGGHGYGMKPTTFTQQTQWPFTMKEWLQQNGCI